MSHNISPAAIDFPPDDEAEMIGRQLQILMRGRPIREAALVARCYFGSQPDAIVAEEFGVASEAIARKRTALQVSFYALRNLLQPPHAAD